MKTPSIFLFALLASVSILRAQGAGELLQVPVSPRNAALGDIAFVSKPGPMCLNYNPAVISFADRPSVEIVYQQYIQDVTGNAGGFILPLGSWTFGATAVRYHMKPEPIYDSLGANTGNDFGYDGTLMPVAVAYNIRKITLGSLFIKDLSFGVSYKSYQEKIWRESSRTTMYDFGIAVGMGRFRFSSVVQNMGGGLFGSDIPFKSRLGLSYVRNDFVLSGEAADMDGERAVTVGSDFPLSKGLSLRGGWKFGQDFGGLSMGLGLRMGTMDLDYSFVRYGDLGDSNGIALKWDFGGKRKNRDFSGASDNNKKDRVKIAIARFASKNVPESIAEMVSSMLRTELIRAGVFGVVDREHTEAVLAEQRLQIMVCTDSDCAVKIGKLLSAQQMVLGNILKSPKSGGYFISINLVDVESGKILAVQNQDVPSLDQLEDACRDIALKLSHLAY